MPQGEDGVKFFQKFADATILRFSGGIFICKGWEHWEIPLIWLKSKVPQKQSCEHCKQNLRSIKLSSFQEPKVAEDLINLFSTF